MSKNPYDYVKSLKKQRYWLVAQLKIAKKRIKDLEARLKKENGKCTL